MPYYVVTCKLARLFCNMNIFLFNIHMEQIMWEVLEICDRGIFLRGKKITNLRYADNLLITSTSVQELATS